MDKIFLTHLHGDHMSDLIHIYCFGAGCDRKSPLFIWGGGPSGVKSPKPPRCLYDDGVKAFCRNLREAYRWHTESQSFISTSYKSYDPPTRERWGLPCEPVPVCDDDPNDGYAIIPIELDWRKYGKKEGDNVAYYNEDSGVKITHFPVIHCRKTSAKIAKRSNLRSILPFLGSGIFWGSASDRKDWLTIQLPIRFSRIFRLCYAGTPCNRMLHKDGSCHKLTRFIKDNI